MIIKCENKKINEAIQKASNAAEIDFIKAIINNTKDLPDTYAEPIIVSNSILVGTSMILAQFVLRTVKTDKIENLEEALNYVLKAVKENALEFFRLAELKEDDDTI